MKRESVYCAATVDRESLVEETKRGRPLLHVRIVFTVHLKKSPSWASTELTNALSSFAILDWEYRLLKTEMKEDDSLEMLTLKPTRS